VSDQPSRRDFLSGRAARDVLASAGNQLADELVAATPPGRGATLMLRTTAMACDFDVILNPDGPDHQIQAASEALDRVHQIESRLTVYRNDSDVSWLNAAAGMGPQVVDAELFSLLARCRDLHRQTGGAFDPAAGALAALWKTCRREGRIPTDDELRQSRDRSGFGHVRLHDVDQSVDLLKEGVRLDFGAIGKGYAVDEAAHHLVEQGVADFLVHGGKSSVVARGSHAGHDGWPVGLQNPLLPDRPFGTILLKNAALGTSGVAVQGYRVGGKRYGHIVDPRTGWPAEELLSASVIAPDAALADALSTAFFVLGVENALVCCDNFPNVAVVLFPYPLAGNRLEPIVRGLSEDRLILATA